LSFGVAFNYDVNIYRIYDIYKRKDKNNSNIFPPFGFKDKKPVFH